MRKYFVALAARKFMMMGYLNFHCEITTDTSMNIKNKLVPFFFVLVCSFSIVNIFFLSISKSYFSVFHHRTRKPDHSFLCPLDWCLSLNVSFQIR